MLGRNGVLLSFPGKTAEFFNQRLSLEFTGSGSSFKPLPLLGGHVFPSPFKSDRCWSGELGGTRSQEAVRSPR